MFSGFSRAYADDIPDPVGHLIINQVYGSGPLDDSGAVSHSFIELYNPTDAAVSLAGWSLQVQNGTANGVEATDWEKLDFNADATVAAHNYFLVRLAEAAPDARCVITKSDIDWADGRIMSNRSYSVALVDNTDLLSQVVTADEMAGVVDLVGALNTAPADSALNFEGAPVTGMSKQKSIRRIDFADTDNNQADFEAIDYRAAGATAISDQELALKGPHYSGGLAFGDGSEEPGTSPVGNLPDHLIINQAAGIGSGGDNQGAIEYSFVEIYNPTDSAVDLSSWSLQYAESGSDWAKLDLEGAIPARCSYLVRMTGTQSTSAAVTLHIPSADLDWDMTISNDAFKFALVDSQDLLSIYNPGKADGVVDLVGANNPPGATDYWEGSGPVAKMSKQQAAGRINFSDYDQNWYDFQSIDYRIAGAAQKFAPHSLNDGPWGLDVVPPAAPPSQDATIDFSKPAGIYADAFGLALTSSDTNLTIHYTLDGNDPTKESAAYTDPLQMQDRTHDPAILASYLNTTGPRNEMPNYVRADMQSVFKGTVVKAQLFTADGTPASQIYVNSYFVNANIASLYGDLPLISMSTPVDNLFSDASGIYVKGPNPDGPYNFDQKGSDWERPVYTEIFDPASGADWETNEVVSQGMGIRIHGGASRHFPQKNFRFYARSGSLNTNVGVMPVINGKDSIDYDLFNGNSKDAQGNTLTGGYKHFMLRAAGNDAALSFMRDAISNRLAGGSSNIENQSYRPAVLFINGEFWGLYQMEERYDEDYLAQHYGGSSSNYSILENPSPGKTSLDDNAAADIDYYEAAVADIQSYSDMNTPEAYADVLKYVDEDSLIDYVILETLGGNLDWVNFNGELVAPYGTFIYNGNNQRMWRYTGTPTGNLGQDGKYRWMLYDTDKSWGYKNGGEVNDPSHNTVNDALCDNLFFFNMLWQNDAFRVKFLNRYAESLDSWLSLDTMQGTVDSIANDLDQAIVEQQKRWPYTLDYTSWTAEVQYIKDWMAQRVAPDGPFMKALAAYTTATPPSTLPSEEVAAYVGEPDSLPAGIDWTNLDAFTNAQAYDTVVLNGAYSDSGVPVSVSVEVIPRNLVYYIDAGTAALTDGGGNPLYPSISRRGSDGSAIYETGQGYVTSTAYAAVVKRLATDNSQLLNSASDQAFDGNWGVTDYQFPVTDPTPVAGVGQKLSTGYVGWDDRPNNVDKNKYVQYELWLPAGDYQVTVGNYCWWDPIYDDQSGEVTGGFARTMEVLFNGQAPDGSSPFTFARLGDNKVATYNYTQTEDGLLSLQVLALDGGDGATLSFIGVTSTSEPYITGLADPSDAQTYAAAYVGATPDLPASVNVRYSNGATEPAQVDWDMGPLVGAQAYDTVALTGAVAGTDLSINASVEVIPQNLVYFIDAAAFAGADYNNRIFVESHDAPYPDDRTDSWGVGTGTSPAYDSVSAKLDADGHPLLNGAPDQFYDGSVTGWGVNPDSYQFTAALVNQPFSKFVSGYVGYDFNESSSDKAKYIEYSLYLPAGNYDITTGHFDWWGAHGGNPRAMDIYFNGDLVYGPIQFGTFMDSARPTINYTQVTDGVLDIRVQAVDDGFYEDGASLTFIGVVDTGEPYITGLANADDQHVNTAVYTDEQVSLPSSVTVQYSDGNTGTATVDWDMAPMQNAQAYDTVELSGAVEGTKLSVSATVEVIPRNLVYFIDSGTAALTDDGGNPLYPSLNTRGSDGSANYDIGQDYATSTAYTSVVKRLAEDGSQLLNGASDQAYDGSWGVDEYQFPVTDPAPAAGVGEKLATGYVGWDDRNEDSYLDKNKYVEYKLWLPAGDYQITTGHYCWWDPMKDPDTGEVTGGFPRTMEVLLNGEAPVGTSPFTFANLGDNMVVTSSYTQAEAGYLDIQVLAIDGGDGATLSFIGVASTGAPYVVGLADSADAQAYSAAYVGAEPDLPASVKVLYSNGSTAMADVAWDLAPLAGAKAYDTVALTGTVDGTGLSVSASVEVIPENLVYFIDAAAFAGADKTPSWMDGPARCLVEALDAPYPDDRIDSWGPGGGISPAYDSVSAKLDADGQPLLNGAADQFYDGSETGWGVNADTYQLTAELVNQPNNKLVSGYVGYDNNDNFIDQPKYIEYSLYLPAGSYEITTGHYDWWGLHGSNPRAMEIYFNGEPVYGPIQFGNFMDSAMPTMQYTQAADGVLDIRVEAVDDGINEDGASLTFIGVVKAADEDVTISYASADEVMGSVSLASESLALLTGTAMGSTAVANAGYHFVSWTDAGGNVVSETAAFVPAKAGGLNAAATYTANFAEDGNVTISYTATTGGSVSLASESLSPATGAALGSTATADAGYHFVNWTDSVGAPVGTDAAFVPAKAGGLNAAATYTANFAADIIQTYKVTYRDDYGNNNPQDTNAYKFDDLVSISSTIPTYSGYDFVGWFYNGAIYNAGETFVMPGANVELVAQWEPKDINVTGATISLSAKTITVGQSFALDVSITPENAVNKAVIWTSSNTKVATVVDGIVTAKAAGTAQITVKTVDGNYSAVCTVTVNPLPTTATPLIATQPASANYYQKQTAKALKVSASTGDKGTLTYQWYSNTTNSTTGAKAITGAKSATYTPPTTKVGALYYFCKVTNTKAGTSPGTKVVNSARALVRVAPDFNKTVVMFAPDASTGLRIDILNQSTAVNGGSALWINNNGPNQRYYLTRDAAGNYQLKSVNSDLYLTVKGGKATSGAAIVQAKSSTSKAQRFQIVYEASGKYSLVSALDPNFVIASSGSSAKSGAAIVLQKRSATSKTQIFRIDVIKPIIATNTVMTIKNAKTGLYMDVTGVSMTNYTPVITWSLNGGANQQFKISYVATTGYYKLVPMNSGKPLIVRSNQTFVHGAAVCQYQTITRLYQQWNIIKHSNGTYSFYQPNSQQALTAAGGSKKIGTPVVIWPYSGTTEQTWKLTKK